MHQPNQFTRFHSNSHLTHHPSMDLSTFGFQEAFNREFKKNPNRDDIENYSTYIFKALSLILTFGYLSSPILKFIPQSGYYPIFSQIAYASFITSACLYVIQWLIAAKHINLEEMIFHNHKLAKTTSLSSRLYYLCHHAQILIKLPISLTLRLWLFSMQALSFVAYKLSFHKISPWISNNFTLLLALSCSLTWIIPAVQSSPTALSLLTNPYFVTASILCLFSLRLLRPFMKKNIKALLYLNGLIIPWRIHNLRVTALTAYQYYIARPFRKIAKNNKVTHIPQNNFDEATSIMNPIGVIDELKEEKASDDFCISQDHFYYLIVFSIHSYFNLITEKAGSLMDLLFKSFHQIIHPQTVNTLCLTLEHGLGAVLNIIQVLYQTLNIVGNLALSIVLTYHPITQKTMSDQLQENWNTLSQLPIDLALNLLHTGKNALLSMYQISLNILNLGKMAIHSLYRLTLFSLKTSGELIILPLYPGYLMAKSLTLHKATHSKARNTIMLRNKIENPRNKKTITPK